MEFRHSGEEGVHTGFLLDALPGPTAVIDYSGKILKTNEAWEQFARENTLGIFEFVGANYLDVCDAATGEDAGDAATVAAAIRNIASGKHDRASLVYPCHSPSEKRWFRVLVSPIAEDEQILIMHTNVTGEHLTRELLQEHELKLHTIVGAQSECIKTLARDGTILEMNEGGMRILGTRDPKDVLGHNVLEFIDLEDHPEFQAVFKQAVEGKSSTLEFRVVGVGGEMAWVRSVLSPMRLTGKAVETVLSITQDISHEKKSIEQARAMRERDSLLSNAIELARLGTWAYDSPSERLVWSTQTCEIFGIKEEDFDGKLQTFLDMIIFEDRAEHRKFVARAEASKEGIIQTHYRVRRPDGEIRWMYERGQAIRGLDGSVVRRLGVVMDNTAQRRVEGLLERSKQLLQIACSAGRLGGWYVSLPNFELDWTPETYRIYELDPEMGMPTPEQTFNFYAPEHREPLRVMFEACYQHGKRFDHEFEIITAKGNRLWVRSIGEPVRDESGAIIAVQGAVQDISEQKSTETTARRLAEELVNTLESISDAFFTVDTECRVLFANPRAAELMEIDMKNDSTRFTIPEWLKRTTCPAVDSARETGRAAEIDVYDPERNRWYGGRAYASPDGASIYLHDETEVRAAKRNMEISEERFRLYASASHDAIWDWNIASNTLWWSQGFHTLFGYDGDFESLEVDAWKSKVHPEDLDRVMDGIQRAIDSGQNRWRNEYRFKKKDGEYAQVSDYGSVIRDDEGKAIRMVGGMSDLTDQKRLEEQVLRAQRLDSLGTLAGGVAHDLNNVLTPILFSVDFMKDETDPAELLKSIEIIESCARRGSQMVSQLLSFARGSQHERVPVRVSDVISDTDRVTRETFPKSIVIRTIISEDLWPALGSSSQIHQVLMNLAVNARDAMPSGGTLTFRASNTTIDDNYAAMNLDARAGAYVKVEVEDTGTGIPPDVLKRIFEPFFTTKEVGKGTGLGLSTVHSILKSHDGFLNVYTEPGEGTRFQVYLPVSGVVDEPLGQKVRSALPRGNGECILVVDDEVGIRTMVKRTLEHYGYRVLLAEHGAEAVSLYASSMDLISAVLTDMAMPIMDGASTVVALRAINPDVCIIGSSGFMARSNQGVSVDLKYFVEKPYSAETMLQTLRHALNDSSNS